jgi:Cyclin, N-terminal domain/Cyclin, C-terminal domain
MRPTLVDFLVKIHGYFCLKPETLHLAINIHDRYMSKAVVRKRYYQVVGMSCLWIAAKFDGQGMALNASELSDLTMNFHDKSKFIIMEHHILKIINWDIGHPTVEAFLQHYLVMDVTTTDGSIPHVARFLMEITLYDARFILFRSHTIAMSCLFAARHIIGIPHVVCLLHL